MPESEAERLLDFRGQPTRRKGRGIHISLAERLRSARRVPQAIVKVTGFSHGKHQVLTQLAYITRKGKLPLEKDNGEILLGTEANEELANNWSADFDKRKRSRDSATIVFSMPPGSEVESLKKAVRTVGAKAFPDNEWVFGIHEDQYHPHAHMMVKMRGREGEKKLQLRKPDLYRLREQFAEAARDNGVELACSPRSSRGVTDPGRSRLDYQLAKRGVSRNKKRLLNAASHKKRSNETAPKSKSHPFLDVVLDYENDAKRLKAAALSRTGPEREKLLSAAHDLESFSSSLMKSHALLPGLNKDIDRTPRKAEKPDDNTGLER